VVPITGELLQSESKNIDRILIEADGVMLFLQREKHGRQQPGRVLPVRDDIMRAMLIRTLNINQFTPVLLTVIPFRDSNLI
jgi:hypothetical protein